MGIAESASSLVGVSPVEDFGVGASWVNSSSESSSEFQSLAGQGHLLDDADGEEDDSLDDGFAGKVPPPLGGLGGSQLRSRTQSPDLQPASTRSTNLQPSQADTKSVNTLCMWEWLRAVKRMNHRKDSSVSNSSDSSIGRGNGLGQLHGVHRRLKMMPQRTIRGYKDFVMEQLWITSRHQYWKYRDCSRCVEGKFGSLNSLFRIHFYLSAILEASQDGNGEEAETMGIQLLKALLQVAVDKGNWQNAEPLMPPQPQSCVHFGGDEHKTQAVFKYQKSLREPRSKNPKGGSADDDDGGEEDGAKKDKEKLKDKGKDDDRSTE